MPDRRTEPEIDPWVQATTRAIARGDRSALGEFYEVWFDRCYALARTLTRRDESLCLDVVQETMLRVIRSLRELRSERELAAWMTRATHSAALDLLRRESRRLRRERAHADEDRGQRAAAVDERIAWLVERLRELPAGDGALVALRLGQGRSLEAVGASAGLSGDAAHGRLRRAMDRLRRWARESEHE